MGCYKNSAYWPNLCFRLLGCDRFKTVVDTEEGKFSLKIGNLELYWVNFDQTGFVKGIFENVRSVLSGFPAQRRPLCGVVSLLHRTSRTHTFAYSLTRQHCESVDVKYSPADSGLATSPAQVVTLSFCFTVFFVWQCFVLDYRPRWLLFYYSVIMIVWVIHIWLGDLILTNRIHPFPTAASGCRAHLKT